MAEEHIHENPHDRALSERLSQLERKQEALEQILARCTSATAAASYAILVLSMELQHADPSLAYSRSAQVFFRKLEEQTAALTKAVEDAINVG